MISWLLCGLGGWALLAIHLWEKPWRRNEWGFLGSAIYFCLGLGPFSWPAVALLCTWLPLDEPASELLSGLRRQIAEAFVISAPLIGVQTMRIAIFDEETFEALAVLDLPEPYGGACDGAVIRFHAMSPQRVFDPPPLGAPVEPGMARYAEIRLRAMLSRMVRGETVQTWVGFTRDRDLVLQRARAEAEDEARSRYYETAQRHVDFGREAQADMDDAAEGRSRDLLRRHLSEAQRDDMDRTGFFTVRAASGCRYRISTATITGNIYRLDEQGYYEAAYCCQIDQSSGRVPRYDHILAQKLALEADEAGFLRTANRLGRDGPDRGGGGLHSRIIQYSAYTEGGAGGHAGGNGGGGGGSHAGDALMFGAGMVLCPSILNAEIDIT